ncbi:hypothetical protein HDU96_008902 [Phlyctochytrium bullatum]|nr:hypothetical protein HDU96_008902 [Phlyctochytrium bullatum]
MDSPPLVPPSPQPQRPSSSSAASTATTTVDNAPRRRNSPPLPSTTDSVPQDSPEFSAPQPPFTPGEVYLVQGLPHMVIPLKGAHSDSDDDNINAPLHHIHHAHPHQKHRAKLRRSSSISRTHRRRSNDTAPPQHLAPTSPMLQAQSPLSPATSVASTLLSKDGDSVSPSPTSSASHLVVSPPSPTASPDPSFASPDTNIPPRKRRGGRTLALVCHPWMCGGWLPNPFYPVLWTLDRFWHSAVVPAFACTCCLRGSAGAASPARRHRHWCRERRQRRRRQAATNAWRRDVAAASAAAPLAATAAEDDDVRTVFSGDDGSPNSDNEAKHHHHHHHVDEDDAAGTSCSCTESGSDEGSDDDDKRPRALRAARGWRFWSRRASPPGGGGSSDSDDDVWPSRQTAASSSTGLGGGKRRGSNVSSVVSSASTWKGDEEAFGGGVPRDRRRKAGVSPASAVRATRAARRLFASFGKKGLRRMCLDLVFPARPAGRPRVLHAFALLLRLVLVLLVTLVATVALVLVPRLHLQNLTRYRAPTPMHIVPKVPDPTSRAWCFADTVRLAALETVGMAGTAHRETCGEEVEEAVYGRGGSRLWGVAGRRGGWYGEALLSGNHRICDDDDEEEAGEAGRAVFKAMGEVEAALGRSQPPSANVTARASRSQCIPNLEYVVFATSCSPGLNRLARLLKRARVPLTILGMGTPWRGWGQRVRAYHDYFVALQDPTGRAVPRWAGEGAGAHRVHSRREVERLAARRVVVVTDGDDVVVNPSCGAEEMVGRFRDRRDPVSRVVFASETACWPRFDWWWKYQGEGVVRMPSSHPDAEVRDPRTSASPFKRLLPANGEGQRETVYHPYLNAGTFWGRVPDAARVMRTAYVDECYDDQGRYTEMYLAKWDGAVPAEGQRGEDLVAANIARNWRKEVAVVPPAATERPKRVVEGEEDVMVRWGAVEAGRVVLADKVGTLSEAVVRGNDVAGALEAAVAAFRVVAARRLALRKAQRGLERAVEEAGVPARGPFVSLDLRMTSFAALYGVYPADFNMKVGGRRSWEGKWRKTWDEGLGAYPDGMAERLAAVGPANHTDADDDDGHVTLTHGFLHPHFAHTIPLELVAAAVPFVPRAELRYVLDAIEAEARGEATYLDDVDGGWKPKGLCVLHQSGSKKRGNRVLEWLAGWMGEKAAKAVAEAEYRNVREGEQSRPVRHLHATEQAQCAKRTGVHRNGLHGVHHPKMRDHTHLPLFKKGHTLSTLRIVHIAICIILLLSILGLTLTTRVLSDTKGLEKRLQYRPMTPEEVLALRHLFAKHAYQNTVMIVPVNSGFLDQFRILLCTATNITDPPLIPHMVVQALDPTVEARLDEIKRKQNLTFGVIPYHPSFQGVTQYTVGNEDFYNMMRARGAFLQHVVETGFDVVFGDSDILYFKNPLVPLLNATESQEADLIASTDSRSFFDRTHDPFEGRPHVPALCFGFFYLRSNPRTQRLLAAVTAMMVTGRSFHDQDALNDVLNGRCENYTVVPRIVGWLPPGLPDTRNGTKGPRVVRFVREEDNRDVLTVRVLDQRRFTNGYLYQTAERSWVEYERVHREEVVMLHGNFGGAWEDKMNCYRRYSWDKIMNRETKECQVSFWDRLEMVHT